MFAVIEFMYIFALAIEREVPFGRKLFYILVR